MTTPDDFNQVPPPFGPPPFQAPAGVEIPHDALHQVAPGLNGSSSAPPVEPPPVPPIIPAPAPSAVSVLEPPPPTGAFVADTMVHDQQVLLGTREAQDAARVETIDLSMWFSGRKVLEKCSLAMEPGLVTALIGPSGCGKSTFLRALNRMHELVPGAALAGQVLLNDTDIYSEELSPTEVRLRIGMVFQKPNPFPAMTIADNVLAGLGLSGNSTEDPEGLVEQSLRRAGLWEEVKDRLHEGGMSLSGGQQQRLCIARSLAVHPDVLLMDEPCSALDPISTRVIEDTIRELCDEITIIIVTHNMQQAQRVSDQCAFFLVETMKEPGRIVEAGPTDRIFSNPSDPRTLDYVNGRFG
jgi:phosphate transport system ATP-binding protein